MAFQQMELRAVNNIIKKRLNTTEEVTTLLRTVKQLSCVSERPFCYSSIKLNDTVSDSHLQELKRCKTIQTAVSSSSYGENMSEI
jgi:hypothetical protein